MRPTRLGFVRRRAVPLRLERDALRRTQQASACEIYECLFQDSDTSVLEETKRQLDEYFAGKRKSFDIQLRMVGTCFQQQVWNALTDIPYGATKSYKDIAQSIGKPQAVRAVAGAVGANGISILIPCHRVIGSDNSLTGYAGGLEAKRELLRIEAQEDKWFKY